MAGLLPGDPSHHGMLESGPYSFSHDKLEEVGRWYLSRKEIEENSPSRRDGIDLKKETYLRKSYCTFLQDLGMRLKVEMYKAFDVDLHVLFRTGLIIKDMAISILPIVSTDHITFLFERGLKRKPMALIKKLRKVKREAPPGEKPEPGQGFGLEEERGLPSAFVSSLLDQKGHGFGQEGQTGALPSSVTENGFQCRPQVTIATAIIFCHRFFLRQSHAKNDRRTIATVCMFLAGKVEETPRPLKDVILVSYEIIHKKDPAAVQRIKQKDPAAVQRIKQKEIYEQQKELILLGERAVLATLGFDLNVHHPYKPLVEAIKKFKVAQNALAQVAWNFVNDGLRTSLCLQFQPHHIAAGAIFLAAKFLKVKLPSDGDKVWWQEFDVTPRQLEEVSNQMLELYEQNRLPPSQGSEVEGSIGGGVSHRAPEKTPAGNEEQVSTNGYGQAGGVSTLKTGTLKLSSRPMSDQCADNQGPSQRNNQNRITNTDMRSAIADHKVDGETKDHQHPEQESLEGPNRSKFGLERLEKEDQERNGGRSETTEAGEWKDNGTSCKSSSTGGRNLEYREGSLGQSPQDAIKKIDKDKVKAALEKRRKARGDVARKMDLMDDDDLIERELEDGIELAAEDEKMKRERRQSWSKPSNRPQHCVEDIGDGNYLVGQSSGGLETENVEEGEVSTFNDAVRSPKSSSRKRKAESPVDKQLEAKQRHDYKPVFRHNHHDIVEDVNRVGRHGYAERDRERHGQENHV
ncbi:hypothetical protein HHK36_023242 [Tetracentron sinense]|uniref:Cyclin-like domain-containing protein n=1 Tax=Tetracentron sinense TaxID=13715 RepID=A0A834YM79_TETSI|nr:hypothetical protein HHK36_023242 [Tetracentron sinense]